MYPKKWFHVVSFSSFKILPKKENKDGIHNSALSTSKADKHLQRRCLQRLDRHLVREPRCFTSQGHSNKM